MPRTYEPKGKQWSQRKLEDAVAERKNLGTPMRKLAKKYGIPRITLSRRLMCEVRKSLF